MGERPAGLLGDAAMNWHWRRRLISFVLLAGTAEAIAFVLGWDAQSAPFAEVLGGIVLGGVSGIASQFNPWVNPS